MKINKKTFYIYVYLDPRKPGKYVYENLSFDYEPFYIGKGYGNRFNDHIIEAKKIFNKKIKINAKNFPGINLQKINKILKIKKNGLSPIILLLKEKITEKNAFTSEQFFIRTIGRYDLNKGPLTNLTNGGEGSIGRIMSKNQKETLRKINEKPIVQFSIDGKFIKIWESAEKASKKIKKHASLIGACLKKRRKTCGNNFWFYKSEFVNGIIPKKLNKKIITNLTTINNDYQKKKVVQFSLSGNYIKTWDSITYASKELKINNINSACNKTIKTAGGFFWFYETDLKNEKTKKIDLETLKKLTTINNDYQKKKVIQFSLNGDYIKEWNSITDASKINKISRTSIIDVCKGKNKTAGGFFWFYKTSFKNNKVPKKLKKSTIKNLNTYENEKNKKKVIQMTIKSKYIKTWSSILEASRALNIHPSGISNVCSGRKCVKISGGFKWKFKK